MALASTPLRAMEDCAPAHDDCVEQGKWQFSVGLGLGLRTNPLVGADDIPLVILPMVNYQGERFFIQNLDIGAILWENDNHQLNVLITPSYDQVFFNRWDPANFVVDGSGFATTGSGRGKDKDLNSLPEIDTGVSGSNNFGGEADTVNWRDVSERHMAGLGGLEYTWSTSILDLQLHWLKDITNIHRGEERRIALARHWKQGRHGFGVSAGALWQSEEVVNYYFGVSPEEADEDNQYLTGSAVSSLVRVDWNYELNSRWDLRALVSYRHLPSEISSSPLVNNNNVVTVFVGGVYHF